MHDRVRPFSAAPRLLDSKESIDLNRKVNQKPHVLSAMNNRLSEEQQQKDHREWTLLAKDRSAKMLITEILGELTSPPRIDVRDDLTANKNLDGYPGGLSMSSADANKYFGTEARLQFFNQQSLIQRQRIISSRNPSDSYIVKEDITPIKNVAEDYAFRPVREEGPIKLSTKVVIRHQTLADSGPFNTQLKLVVKNTPKGSRQVPLSSTLMAKRQELVEGDGDDNDNLDEQKEAVEEDTSSIAHLRAIIRSKMLTTMKPRPKSSHHHQSGHHHHHHHREKKSANSSQTLYLNRDRPSSSSTQKPIENQQPHFRQSHRSSASQLSESVVDVIHPLVHNISSKSTNSLMSPTIGSKGKTKSNLLTIQSKNKNSISTDKADEQNPSINLSNTEQLTTAKNKLNIITKSVSDDINFDKNQSETEPVHLVCVENSNRLKDKVLNKLKNNTLFHYVEKERSQLKNTISTELGSDDDSFEEEMNAIRNTPTNISSRPASARAVLHSRMANKNSLKMLSPAAKAANVATPESTPMGSTFEDALSPRSQYIDSCIRQKLNPRLSLLLRKNFSKRLQLQHHGIGDDMALLFADAIVNIPYVQALNIADNNLTDKSLAPIVNAISQMKDLVDLNMSFNTIGPKAAASLSEYLSTPTCALERLVLCRADVDDGEGEQFISALKNNKSLKELDLSENLIGSHEQLNTVMPDITTGGEALAELLSSPNCILETLKLGWNMIRLDSANQLCQSVRVNKSLTYLDLSYNALGTEGGLILGSSLIENKCLKSLSIANNSIDSIGCVAICAGVLENDGLSKIVLDGNPIGEEGAKALMLLPTMVGYRVEISAASCNLGIRDPKNWFSASSLMRVFNLTLSDPFHRAVAIMIMHIIPAHRSYIIANSIWTGEDNGKSVTVKLDLAEKVVVDFASKRLNALQIKQIESLRKVKAAAEDTQNALVLFAEVDEDGSGLIDEDELGKMFDSLGFDFSEDKVREIVEEYDMDQRGGINLKEFLLFLRHQLKDTTSKLSGLTEFPLISLKSESTPIRYVPPSHGNLSITIVDGFTPKEYYRIISDSDRKCIDNLASQTGDIINMTTYGIQTYRIRFGEAMGLVESMSKESNNKIFILSKVLPQVATALDARKLVNKVLRNNKIEIVRLKREVGSILRPILGNADGYYSLDLSQPMDRLCLDRLLEVSSTSAHLRSSKSKLGYGGVGDCSQKGNWTCFRNEWFNGKPVAISSAFLSPMPKSGKLEFDFVSERRCGKDDFVMSDLRVVTTLIGLFQLPSKERADALTRLEQTKKLCDNTLHGDAKTVYERPMDVAKEVGMLMEEFYANLQSRGEQLERNRLNEAVKVKLKIDERLNSLTAQYGRSFIINRRNAHKFLKIQSLSTIVNLTEMHREKLMQMNRGVRAASVIAKPTNSGFDSATMTAMKLRNMASRDDLDDSVVEEAVGEDIVGEPVQEPGLTVQTSLLLFDDSFHEKALLLTDSPITERDMDWLQPPGEESTGSTKESADELGEAEQSADTKPLDEWMLRYVRLLASPNVPPNARAAKVLDVLVEAFEHSFFMCRHLELMCDLFQGLGVTPTSEFFGTYRVELVVALFGCLVDLHNLEIVLRALTAFETACVLCRVGWLHVHNPMKPQGAYELDLSRHEERQVLKTLTMLSTHEPGDSLVEMAFRWERNMPPMPGFELTVPWMTEEGLPRNGLFNACFYAGEGKGKKGCKPVVKWRKSLLQMVLIDEEEVCEESWRDNPDLHQPELVGESFMLSNTAAKEKKTRRGRRK